MSAQTIPTPAAPIPGPPNASGAFSRAASTIDDEFTALLGELRKRMGRYQAEVADLSVDLRRAQGALDVALACRVEVGRQVAALVDEAHTRYGLEVGDLPVWLRSWGDTLDDRALLSRLRAQEVVR